MPSPRIFNVTCSCSKQKKFPLAINVKECPGAMEEVTIQHPCPNAFESFCHKYVNVTFPPGIQPDMERINRHIDGL